MGLYKLFSCNVEIQYRGRLLSKAMVFTIIIKLLNVVLPFIVAYRSRGFWLRTHYFYEQPVVYSTFNYLLIAETDDPSVVVTCGDAVALTKEALAGEEYCAETQIQEDDHNGDGKNDRINSKFHLNLPLERSITSIVLLYEIDFQLRFRSMKRIVHLNRKDVFVSRFTKSMCPLQMKSLVVINKEFALPSSLFQYYGDVKVYQNTHLPCQHNIIHTKYNNSMFHYVDETSSVNVIDLIMKHFLQREVSTKVSTSFSRTSIGHTGSLIINVSLQIPEGKVTYVPSLLQELKWAWPQYLSLALVFYWFFERVKKFVFNNRLFMAWEVVPWKKFS